MTKIPMKKRERPEQRSTTFTKRRNGLFTKAEELCVLCDAQIAMLVTSPNKKHSKIYSFGHSLVFDAFLNDDFPDPVDDETKKSALSLYNESKELEHYMKNKRSNIETNRWKVENFDNIQSVEVWHLLRDKMKILKANMKIRLDTLKSPTIATSGFNSADATVNHGDGDGDGNGQFKHDNNITVIGNSSGSFDAASGTSFGSIVAAGDSNHDNGNGHFKHGQSQYDTNYEDFSTLPPLEFFNDYSPNLSSIYGSSFVDVDYSKIVPESASGLSNTGQIVEGNTQKYDVQQNVTSLASKPFYNFDRSYVGGEQDTKKADECIGVKLKDKEANSWVNTVENLLNFDYLNQEVMSDDWPLP